MNTTVQYFTQSRDVNRLETTTTAVVSVEEEDPAYVTYFAIAETWLTIPLNIGTVVVMSMLLFLAKFRPWKLKVARLSGAMLVYIVVHLLGNATSIPYGIYRVLRWVPTPDRPPNTGMYDPYMLYWIGLPEVVYMSIGPVPCFFLTLERIWSLKISGLTATLKELAPYLAVATTVVVYAFNFGVYLLELPLDIPAVYQCEFVPCLMYKYRGVAQLFLKMAFGSVNFISCVFFLRLLKQQSSTSINDRVVRITIVLELFIDMLPTYAGWIFNVVTRVSGSRYLGEDISLFVAFDTMFCGSYYLWCFYDGKGAKGKKSGHTLSSGVNHSQLVMAVLNAPPAVSTTGGRRVPTARRHTVAAVWPATGGHFVNVGGACAAAAATAANGGAAMNLNETIRSRHI